MIEREFLATVTTMRPTLSKVALRIVGNEQDAADVVQDSYLRAWRALPGFKGDSKLSTWLHAIVVNTSLSALQGRRRHATECLSELEAAQLADPRAVDPQRGAEQSELRQELLRAIRRLSASSREVIVLRELRGLSHTQIAKQLGISETASKVRLHRARAQLQTSLRDRLHDDTAEDRAISA